VVTKLLERQKRHWIIRVNDSTEIYVIYNILSSLREYVRNFRKVFELKNDGFHFRQNIAYLWKSEKFLLKLLFRNLIFLIYFNSCNSVRVKTTPTQRQTKKRPQ